MTSSTSIRIDAEHLQSFRGQAHDRPSPALGADVVEAEIHDESPSVADDRPYEKVERHRAVVNVAEDEIVSGGPVKVGVADRIDLVRLGRHPIRHYCYLVLI